MPRGRLGGLGGSPGPYPGGRLRGLARAGLQAHTRGEVERSGPGLGVQAQGGVSQHALRQTPPQQMATAADGTHPTGMHSCFLLSRSHSLYQS